MSLLIKQTGRDCFFKPKNNRPAIIARMSLFLAKTILVQLA